MPLGQFKEDLGYGGNSKSLYKIGNFDAQGVSDDLQCLNCDIAFAALNFSHVCSIQPGAIGENVLGPAAL